ncbi:MAG: phosphopentomutase [Nitriliruptorales bacterium]
MSIRELNRLSHDPPASAGRRRIVVVVCDSLGIGDAPDAAAYGDSGADTLGHVAAALGGLNLPTLGRWGIGHLTDVAGVPPVEPPAGVVARLRPTAAGKDSTTGHWELMGCRTDQPFPTYPDGFPPEVITPFEESIGRPVLGNYPTSGTVIIEELGVEHVATGHPIVYTSGDSVFQIATHVDVVPLARLYEWCEAARRILVGRHRVGRVIARPFTGEPGAFTRTTDRRDFAVEPPEPTACDVVHGSGIPVKAVGKIEDLFVRRGITLSDHTGDDESGLAAILRFLHEPGPAFVVANLVDLDQRYGHRLDVSGYGAALERIDAGLERIAVRLGEDDVVIVCADHGTDPTQTHSTDHTREYVPMVAWTPALRSGADLGERSTFADVGATVLDLFGLDPTLPAAGRSFAGAVDGDAGAPGLSP